MAQQIITLSTNSYVASGDTIRSAFIKANDNFAEIYSIFPDNFSGNTEFQVINLSNGIGTVTGDTVREAFIKINNNFTILWADFQSTAGEALSGNILANALLEVNVGVGSDTQTSDTVFEGFEKVNENFTNLYAILGLGVTAAQNTAYGQADTRTINLYLQSTAGNTDSVVANLISSAGQQIIDTGSGAGTQTGDTVYSAFVKINENFTQLYTVFGNDGISLNANAITSNTVTTSGNITAGNLFAYDYVVTNGNVVASNFLFPNGIAVTGGAVQWAAIESNLIPNTNAVYTLGNVTNNWSNVYIGDSLILDGGVISYNGNLLLNGIPIGGIANVTYDSNSGNLTVQSSNGTDYVVDIGVGRSDSPTFATVETTGNLTVGGETVVSGNIIPSANITYDLGTVNSRFKDLYLSGNTLHLGESLLQTDGTNVTITNPLGGAFTIVGNAVSEIGHSININGTEVISNTGTVVTSQLEDSGVTAGTYGNASSVPQFTVDAKGRVTNVANIAVAGVSNVAYDQDSGNLTISTSSGTDYIVDISVGRNDDPIFTNLDIRDTTTTNLLVVNTSIFADSIQAATIGNVGTAISANTGLFTFKLTAGNVATGPINSNGVITTDGFVSNGYVRGVTATFSTNVITSNVYTGGVNANGTITANNLTVNNATQLGNTLTVADNVVSNANVTAQNIISNNLVSTATIETTGNVTVGNGIVATGNIEAASAHFSGNVDIDGWLNVDTVIYTNIETVVTQETTNTLDVNLTANIGTNLTVGALTTTDRLAVNANADISGNLSVTNLITADKAEFSSLNNTPIGNATASTGAFTTLGATGNLTVSGNAIIDQKLSIGSSNVSVNSSLQVHSNDSILIPVGDNTNRPAAAAQGMFRFSTNSSKIEWYTGSAWESPLDQFTLVVSNVHTADGSTTEFTLPISNASPAGTIVSVNGIVQQPGVSYSITGSTLTFYEAPLDTDNIDVRIFTTTSSVTALADALDRTKVAVDWTAINDNKIYFINNQTESALFEANSQFKLISNIGSTSYDSGAMVVTGGIGVSGNVYVNDHLYAVAKSFLIDHPSKVGYKLQYACLEGPENGVYVRGKSQSNVIALPDYWINLVDDHSITVDLTSIGKNQQLYVEKIENNCVYVASDNVENRFNYFYTVWAERKDIDKLVVEHRNPE